MTQTKPVRVTAGRLTLPREIRRALGLEGDHETVTIEVEDGRAIVRPAEVRPRMSAHEPSARLLELMQEASRTGSIQLTADELRDLANASTMAAQPA